MIMPSTTMIFNEEQKRKDFKIMNDLTRISRGEVFYITSHLDTVGSEQRSGRPAVIVSNNMCNEFSPVVEICYLTLQEKKSLPTHIKIDRGACVNSTVLCEQVTTISKERVGDYMCTLPDDIMDSIDKALVISLGLDYIIEQGTKKPVTSTSAEIPDSTLREIESMRAEIKELSTVIDELTVARDSAIKKAEDLAKKVEGADSAKQEAKLYKKMYDNLLDKVLGK